MSRKCAAVPHGTCIVELVVALSMHVLQVKRCYRALFDDDRVHPYYDGLEISQDSNCTSFRSCFNKSRALVCTNARDVLCIPQIQ